MKIQSKSTIFSESSKFIKSLPFVQSSIFTKSSLLTESSIFSKSTQFTGSSVFTELLTSISSSELSKPIQFTKSSTFTKQIESSMNSQFTKSSDFTKLFDTSNPSQFTTLLEPTETIGFNKISESSEITENPTSKITQSDSLSSQFYSKATDFVTIQPIKSSFVITFKKSSVFTTSAQFIDKEVNNIGCADGKTKKFNIWIIVGIVLGVLLIAAIIIIIIVVKRRNEKNQDSQSFEAQGDYLDGMVQGENSCEVSFDNPLREEPFLCEDPFDREINEDI